MFNACRKGPASISRVFRAATSTARIPSTRPSTLRLSIQNASKPALEARWLHVSSRLRHQAAASRQRYDDNRGAQKDFPKLTKFQELVDHNLVHPNVIKTITDTMKYESMTDVQSMTINQGLQGDDIIAQARTGTGKTLGFLVPTVQRILERNPDLAVRKEYSKARASDIQAIIISPTRELAEQIATEAAKLTQATDLIVQVAVGGNSKREMLYKTRREGCHILVGTPGRLYDVLSDEYNEVSAPNLAALVLDEADRLLDQGFSIEIDKITELLPNRREVDRQTMLFSATIPKEVMHLVRRTLKPQFHFVQTVKDGEQATHEKVPQKIVSTPGLENHLPALFELCKREIDKHAKGQGPPFKAIVYFQATANVQLSYKVFDKLTEEKGGQFGKKPLDPAEILEIHGQLPQNRREYTTDQFRRAQSAILFSTDVTARGMDFPNVTHVIQIGLASNRDQYIHRVGRTGRADKTGTGVLIVHEDQVPDARRMLKGLPIQNDTSLEAAHVDMTKEAQLPASLAYTLGRVSAATNRVDSRLKEAAYQQMSGNNAARGISIYALDQWIKYGWGWDEPPDMMGGRGGGGRGFGGSGGGERGFGGSGGGERGYGGDRRGGGYGGRGGGYGGRGGGRGGGRDRGQDDFYF